MPTVAEHYHRVLAEFAQVDSSVDKGLVTLVASR
jgi:hypothetical protein